MAMKTIQPLWYHPTQVLLVDDDEKILRSLGKEIDPSFRSIAYKNPKAALEYLKKKEHVLPLDKFSKVIISDVDTCDAKALLGGDVVAINLKPLRTDLTKPIRFTQCVVAIVDKVMKEMDGLDFCREVRKLGLPVKLILLTGNAGADEAVAAFNNRIIDGFIRKSPDIDMMDEVNQQVNALSFQVFCEASTQLLGSVLHRFPLIQQKDFSEFLQKLCQEQGIVEYFMLDSSCSYLLLLKTGKAKVFMIRSPEDFKNAYDIYDGTGSEKSVLEALKNRTVFPFTGTETYFLSDKVHWKDSMVSMTKLDKLGVYYAVVDYPDEKVFSFEQYVNEIWKPEIID